MSVKNCAFITVLLDLSQVSLSCTIYKLHDEIVEKMTSKIKR
jgi:hypothetical protein